jgi:hypothetical protein
MAEDDQPTYEMVPPGGAGSFPEEEPEPASEGKYHEALQDPDAPFRLPCGHFVAQRRSGPVWCGLCRRWWPIAPSPDEIAYFGEGEGIPEDGGEFT